METEPSPTQAFSGTGQISQPLQREEFSAEELGVVLSRYDLGIIHSISRFPRGSRKAPKLLISSERGQFLLKRRAPGKDDPTKVAFAHQLQMFLAASQFPLPRLIRARPDQASMVRLDGNVYELFEYISGQPYPMTATSTFDAGRILGLFHKLLLDFRTDYQPPGASYHNHPSIGQALQNIPRVIPQAGTGLGPVLSSLRESYLAAADQAERAGLQNWPKQFIHGDWHPGNMLFREDRVVAVIDYDSARLLPRVIDAANGALQFSTMSSDQDVARWPESLDCQRFLQFVRGYDRAMLLSDAEIRILPWLMIEALIAQAILPIATTGTFGRIDGAAFLRMVQRKAAWIARSADQLTELLNVR